MNIEQINRERLRWHILSALNRFRPSHPALNTLAYALSRTDTPHTLSDIIRELDYLGSRGLLSYSGNPHNPVIAISRVGVDVVEGTVPCEPGIARTEIG